MLLDLNIKIAIITLLITFPIIFYTEFFTYPEAKKIEEISLLDLNKPAIIEAKPTNQNIHKNHLMLELKQNNSKIDAIFFEHNYTLKEKNSKFIVKITQYQAQPQVQIEKIISK